MSKFKTPREKKLASLAFDNRNVYGNNDKASRRLIPLLKKQSHQALRRAAKRPLLGITSALQEDDFVQAESAVRSSELSSKRKSFKKTPDAPLSRFLEYKQDGDWQALTRKRI